MRRLWCVNTSPGRSRSIRARRNSTTLRDLRPDVVDQARTADARGGHDHDLARLRTRCEQRRRVANRKIVGLESGGFERLEPRALERLEIARPSFDLLTRAVELREDVRR